MNSTLARPDDLYTITMCASTGLRRNSVHHMIVSETNGVGRWDMTYSHANEIRHGKHHTNELAIDGVLSFVGILYSFFPSCRVMMTPS